MTTKLDTSTKVETRSRVSCSAKTRLPILLLAAAVSIQRSKRSQYAMVVRYATTKSLPVIDHGSTPIADTCPLMFCLQSQASSNSLSILLPPLLTTSIITSSTDPSARALSCRPGVPSQPQYPRAPLPSPRGRVGPVQSQQRRPSPVRCGPVLPIPHR